MVSVAVVKGHPGSNVQPGKSSNDLESTENVEPVLDAVEGNDGTEDYIDEAACRAYGWEHDHEPVYVPQAQKHTSGDWDSHSELQEDLEVEKLLA